MKILIGFFILMNTILFAQVPDTIIFIEPGQNIQAIVNAQSSNTLYILKEGIHRMQRIIPKSNDIFIGEPGAILNGGLVLDNWIQEGDYWTHLMPEIYASTSIGNYLCKCEQEYPLVEDDTCGNYKRYTGCLYYQSLFMDNNPLWRETGSVSKSGGYIIKQKYFPI